MIGPVLIVLILLLVLIGEYYEHKLGVPTITSFPEARKKIAALLGKHFESSGPESPCTIIDLGSGKGQLCRRIAREMPNAHVIGIELSPLPWIWSFVTQRLLGPANVEFKRRDLWTYDSSPADAVVLFLTGKEFLARVGEKLRRELKPGALIIANDEPLGFGWEPIEVIDNLRAGIFHSRIFIYRQA